MNRIHENPVAQAVAAIGGLPQLARAANVSHEAARKWLLAGCVPAKRARQIEALTGVERAALCPQIFGTAPATKAAP
jgi:DNA-binding transcriptional regulator YdaS (Cro superfamily)